MKLSKKWLQDFVFLPDSLSALELGRELSLRTVEVEGVENQAAAFENIVVGEIVSVEKHPNADKLSLTKVDIGSGSLLQIVCGAPNVAAGQTVLVAISMKLRAPHTI
jgi:phenylalanyl-tRNA synthetase beta chain